MDQQSSTQKMIIELNDAEQRLAKYLAIARHRNARKKGIVNNRIGPQSDELTDLEGIAGEIAFCKMMNVYPDLQIEYVPNYDCILPDGTKVDVKTTKYDNGKLLSAPWKGEKNIDVFALMVGQMPKYRYAGMMKAKDLLQEHRKQNLGHGVGYVATQDELYK